MAPLGFAYPIACTLIQGQKKMNIKILGAFAAVTLLAACADQTKTEMSSTGKTVTSIVPGSQEDLVANVGDRVFYDFNMSALRADGRDRVVRPGRPREGLL